MLLEIELFELVQIMSVPELIEEKIEEAVLFLNDQQSKVTLQH